MNNNIQDQLIALLIKSLTVLGWDKDYKETPFLDLTRESRFGDFTTNLAMKLSKILMKSPREIANSLIDCMLKESEVLQLNALIKEIKVEGAGFINFYLNDSYFYARLQDILSRESEALRVDLGKGKRLLIEFVSANPTGSLSVAHARQAAVGDCLSNILDFIGFKVQREYYLNDEGNQINILGNSTELRLRELNGEKIDFPQNCYQGDYIYDIAKLAKDGNIPSGALGDFAADYILKIIRQELDDFGVKFDCWYSQKELAKSGKVEKTFDYLKSKGCLYEEDGALWFKSTLFGDDKDRVIVKSDSSQTYLAPDIAYHEDKFQRGYDWLINLWGPDHHGYINRIKASIQAFGHKSDDLSIIIVQLATIFRNGAVEQMSTRKGQYITLREVLDEVGKDAARFFFVMRRTNSHLDFDLDVAKKQSSENPVYYVQYAHARICSIIRAPEASVGTKTPNLELLIEKEELALIKKLAEFQSILIVCLSTLDPYMLTVYLQSLAEYFHKFYDSCRVLGQSEELTVSRLSLLKATKIVLSLGLELLGVSRPEKM